MVLPIVLGAASGILGFVPLVLALRQTKKVTDTSNLGHAGALLLGVLASFILLFATAIACVLVDRPSVLPFVLAEAITLCVAGIAFGLYRHFR